MIIGYVFVGATLGILLAVASVILLDFSFLGAALIYSIVGSLGVIAAASLCLLRTNDSRKTPMPSTENSDGALSRL